MKSDARVDLLTQLFPSLAPAELQAAVDQIDEAKEGHHALD
jgi:hypothetical protein